MGSNTVFVLCLILCLSGCIFCLYWIKNARDFKDITLGVVCLITCAFMLIVSGWCIIYNNNLLWYGQHKENARIEMNINDKEVESSSFIYLLEKFDADTTVADVISIMGNNYDESDTLGYEMTYRSSNYTINGSQSTFITFVFNRRKTEILSIKWAYQSPSSGMFTHVLEYLENNAFGQVTTSSANKADWRGLHLEDTGYYLLLIREF